MYMHMNTYTPIYLCVKSKEGNYICISVFLRLYVKLCPILGSQLFLQGSQLFDTDGLLQLKLVLIDMENTSSHCEGGELRNCCAWKLL